MTHEPSAILTAYTLGKGSFTEPVNVAVVDFGAGSLQITVASIEEGVVDTKSVQGTPEIGGDIIDLRLLDHLIGKFHRLYGTGMLCSAAFIIKLMRDSQMFERIHLPSVG